MPCGRASWNKGAGVSDSCHAGAIHLVGRTTILANQVDRVMNRGDLGATLAVRAGAVDEMRRTLGLPASGAEFVNADETGVTRIL